MGFSAVSYHWMLFQVNLLFLVAIYGTHEEESRWSYSVARTTKHRYSQEYETLRQLATKETLLSVVILCSLTTMIWKIINRHRYFSDRTDTISDKKYQVKQRVTLNLKVSY